MAAVERGDRAPTLTTVEAFARALHVPVAELVADEPGSGEYPPLDRAERIAGRLRDRGPDYLAAVEKLLTVFDRIAKPERS